MVPNWDNFDEVWAQMSRYMEQGSTSAEITKVFASQHGLENRWSAKLKGGEGTVDVGTPLFLDASGYARVFRHGTSSSATGKVITMTAGHELRFRVGDIVVESTTTYASKANAGAITAIDTTAHTITVTENATITGGGYLWVANASNGSGTDLPTIVGFTWFTASASDIGATSRHAPIVYVRHCYMLENRIPFYGKTDPVITKARTDLYGMFDLLPESVWVA